MRVKMNTSSLNIVSFLLSGIPGLIFTGVNSVLGTEDFTIPILHEHEPIIFDDFIGTIEERGQLIVDLFQNYDQRNYPVNATLQLGLSLISIDADSPRRNVFHADVLLRHMWNDPRLKWEPANYGGHSMFSVPAFQVWKPDIRLLNSAVVPSFHSCHEANVIISWTGDVKWVVPCLYVAYCNQTASSSDFNGIKKCGLTLGSWSWDGCPLDLQLYKNQKAVDMTFFHDVTPWNVTESSSSRTEKHETKFMEKYPIQISFDFCIKRKPQVFYHHPYLPYGPPGFYGFH